MITGPFQASVDGVVDTETGLAVDVPLFRQVHPGWIKENPEAYDRIKAERERLGLKVEDGFVEKPEKPKMRKRTKFTSRKKVVS